MILLDMQVFWEDYHNNKEWYVCNKTNILAKVIWFQWSGTLLKILGTSLLHMGQKFGLHDARVQYA